MNEPHPELQAALRRHLAAEKDAAGCRRELELSRFAAGELSPEEEGEFRRHLAECPECRLDLQRLELEAAAPQPSPRPRALSRWTRPAGWIAAAAAVACGLLVLLARPAPGPGGLREKGRETFQLFVAARRQGRVERLPDGARIAAGDELGFFYTAAHEGYLMVLYASETELQRAFPAGQPRSAEVPAGRERPVPDGAVAGPGQGCEWIVGLFSRRPLEEAEALERLRALRERRRGCRLDPPADGEVSVSVVEVRR